MRSDHNLITSGMRVTVTITEISRITALANLTILVFTRQSRQKVNSIIATIFAIPIKSALSSLGNRIMANKTKRFCWTFGSLPDSASAWCRPLFVRQMAGLDQLISFPISRPVCCRESPANFISLIDCAFFVPIPSCFGSPRTYYCLELHSTLQIPKSGPIRRPNSGHVLRFLKMPPALACNTLTTRVYTRHAHVRKPGQPK